MGYLPGDRVMGSNCIAQASRMAVHHGRSWVGQDLVLPHCGNGRRRQNFGASSRGCAVVEERCEDFWEIVRRRHGLGSIRRVDSLRQYSIGFAKQLPPPELKILACSSSVSAVNGHRQK